MVVVVVVAVARAVAAALAVAVAKGVVVGVVAVVVAVAVMFFDPLRALRARLFNSSSGYCHSFVGLDRQIGSSSPALDENGTICDNGVHTHTHGWSPRKVRLLLGCPLISSTRRVNLFSAHVVLVFNRRNGKTIKKKWSRAPAFFLLGGPLLIGGRDYR